MFRAWFISVFVTAHAIPASGAIVVTSDLVHGANSITVDTDQGLDFLDVELSTNRSFNDVSTQFGPGGDFEGFRYATEVEVLNLFNTAFDPNVSPGGDVIATQSGSAWFDLVNNVRGSTPTPGLTQILGLTSTPSNVFMRAVRPIAWSPPARDRLISDATSPADTANSSLGSYLVRTTSFVIPEPCSVGLLFLGLVLVAFKSHRIPT